MTITKQLSFLKIDLNLLEINVSTQYSYSTIFTQVPNALGFVLGTTQLIVYLIYRRKTPLTTEDGPIDEEQGSPHLGGKLEMVPKGNLMKGSISLPKKSLSRQDSSVKIIKALSMPPLELYNLWKEPDRAQENGAKN